MTRSVLKEFYFFMRNWVILHFHEIWCVSRKRIGHQQMDKVVSKEKQDGNKMLFLRLLYAHQQNISLTWLLQLQTRWSSFLRRKKQIYSHIFLWIQVCECVFVEIYLPYFSMRTIGSIPVMTLRKYTCKERVDLDSYL